MTKREIALEARGEIGARLFSPSAARNRHPIRDVLLAHCPPSGAILEIGSGTGEHAVCFAASMPENFWLPGDPDPAACASIAAWTAYEGLSNIAPPHALDVMVEGWERGVGGAVAAMVSINMIHIAPIEAAQGLFRGAERLLAPGGKLFLYGPFSRRGAHTAKSNAEFDGGLKARDSRWGVRDLERDIAPLAEASRFRLDAAVAMPADNLTAVFTRA